MVRRRVAHYSALFDARLTMQQAESSYEADEYDIVIATEIYHKAPTLFQRDDIAVLS